MTGIREGDCSFEGHRRVTLSNAAATADPAAEAVARAFVAARRNARALADFPGPIPATMAQAYRIQDAALALWPDRVVGWKVGLIAPELRERLGSDRLSGPIFSGGLLQSVAGAVTYFPVFEGGFAAVEGEFVMRLGEDAPAKRTDWTAADAGGLVDAMFIGVETAGSPLATINELGPTVVASDFGNNAGLILGAQIPDWRARIDELACETSLEGRSVGRGRAADLPGGPSSALAFLLNNLAVRGRPARAGDLISTGAVTGIHDIRAGQSARANFGAFGDILCQAEMARPEPA
jgi:2-keto-4-pentenoate hydratase